TFYASLGAKWISEMVSKKTQPQGIQRVTEASQKLELLIRDRAPLLLHEFTPIKARKAAGTAQLVRSSEWLAKHLSVRQADAIHLYQTFRPTGQSDRSPATACVLQAQSRDQPSGWMQAALSKVSDSMEMESWVLVIAPLENSQWDPFDVANAIGLLVLDMCRVKDTLLISTLLTSPLDGLRRKGFPVDRVMRPKQQPKAPPALPADQQPPSYESLKRQQTAEETVAEKHIKEMFPQMTPQEAQERVQRAAKESGANATLQEIVSRAASQLMEKDKKKQVPSGSGPSREPPQQSTGANGAAGPPAPTMQPTTAVTPQQTQILRTSLQRAVQSTVQQAGARNAQIDVSLPTPEPVKPFASSGACAAIPVQRLQLVGRVDNIEVFVDMHTLGSSPRLPTEYQATLPLFTQVLRVLSERVFQLDAHALHVFVDRDSPIIAFNRARALFFNLRFFVGLGHADVVHGGPAAGLTQADVYAYWFMTFCHELAHHFVAAHDAAHGFYMAAFAEEYMSKLIKLFRQ
ncbi:hypothetical protein EC988_004313, partial [Linderina pennispora]